MHLFDGTGYLAEYIKHMYSKLAGYFLMTLLCGSLSAGPYLQIQQVRSLDYPYVTAELSIAKKLPIDNIDPRSIKLYENNWQIRNFSFRKLNPAQENKNVILLIDTSLSLSTKEFKHQITAAKSLAEKLNQGDTISAISFGEEVNVKCDFTGNFTQFSNCLDSLKRKGKKTVLYDAVLHAYQLAGRLTRERKAVILFTDGRDDGSTIKASDLISVAAASHIPLYLAAVKKTQTVTNLSRIAQVSGGETFYTKDFDNLSNVFSLMQSLLDNTYVIRYLSDAATTSTDGRQVVMTIELQTELNNEPLNDRDDYIYQIPLSDIEVWLRKAWIDERYFLFILGIICITVLFTLVIGFAPRRAPQPATAPTPAPRKAAEIDKPQDSLAPKPYVAGTRVEPNIQSFSPFVSEPGTNLADENQSQVKLPLREQGIAYLHQKSGPDTGKRFFLDWTKATIGRDKENSLVLDDDRVENFHARVEKIGKDFFLFDLLSENGIYLNGKKLLRPKHLQDFDEISIGSTQLLFRRILR